MQLAIIRFFWRECWQFKWLTFGVLITAPITHFVHIFASSLIVAHIIDRLTRHDYIENNLIASFGVILTIYIVTYIIGNVILHRLLTFLTWRLETRVVTSVAQKTFDHLISLDANFHTNRFGGALVSQANRFVDAYERLATTTVTSFIPLLSTFVFATIILLPRAPLYIPVLFFLGIGYLGVAFLTAKRIRHFNTAESRANSRQTGLLADSITNIMTIKSFARDQHESRRYAKATTDTADASYTLLKATVRRDTQFSLVGSCFSIGAVIMVVASVMYLQATIATAFLVLTYSLTIAQRLWDFSSNALHQYNKAFGDAYDMFTTMQHSPKVVDTSKPQSRKQSAEMIVFDAISFTHHDANDTLFKHFSLTIKKGEKVGLVGRSGSGKTTLARLLLRFADVEAGMIRLQGTDIRELRQATLRGQMSYVPQEPLLFHRSIKENIGYGKPGATIAQIRAAARKANALGFIEKLPSGFETLVGERGVKLSGGQRQRIAIARAILKNAPILVLDEATSALDSESEKSIQDALKKLMKGRTAIVVAHRLSTIAHLDRIIVLDKGKIIEEGSHKMLLRQKGLYAKLWAHQSGGFLED